MIEKERFQAPQEEVPGEVSAEVERIREQLRKEAEHLRQASREQEADKRPVPKRSLSLLKKQLLWLLNEIQPYSERAEDRSSPDREAFLRAATLICLGSKGYESNYALIASTFKGMEQEQLVVEEDSSSRKYYFGKVLRPSPTAGFKDVQASVSQLLEAAQKEQITPKVATLAFLLQRSVPARFLDAAALEHLEGYGLVFRLDGQARFLDWFFRGAVAEAAKKQAETTLRLRQRDVFSKIAGNAEYARLLLRGLLSRVMSAKNVGGSRAPKLSEEERDMLGSLLVFVAPGQRTVVLFEDDLVNLLKARFPKEHMEDILLSGLPSGEASPAQIVWILRGGLEPGEEASVPIPLATNLDGDLYLLERTERELQRRFVELRRPAVEVIALLQKRTRLTYVDDSIKRLILSMAKVEHSLNPGDLFENFSILSGFDLGASLDQLGMSVTPILKKAFPQILSHGDVTALHLLELATEKRVHWSAEDRLIYSELAGASTLDELFRLGFLSQPEPPELSNWVKDTFVKAALAEILPPERWTEEMEQRIRDSYTILSDFERCILHLMTGKPVATTVNISSSLRDSFAAYLVILGVDLSTYRKLRKLFCIFSTPAGLAALFSHPDTLESKDATSIWKILVGRERQELTLEALSVVRLTSLADWFAALRGQPNNLAIESLLCAHVLTVSSDGQVWLTDVGHGTVSSWFKLEFEALVEKLRNKGIPVEGQKDTARIFKTKIADKLYTLIVAPALQVESAAENYFYVSGIDEGLKVVTSERIDVRTAEAILVVGTLLNPYKTTEKRNAGLHEFVREGGTVIDLARGNIISALPQAGQISRWASEVLDRDLEQPLQQLGVIEELRRALEAKARQEADKEKEERAKKEREREKELRSFDELVLSVFLKEIELELEVDVYIAEDGLRPFTLLFHGLPGCGKSAQIAVAVRKLLHELERRGKPCIMKEISITQVVDGRISLVDFCRLYTEDALLKSKNSPYLLVIKDLDALTEKKELSTAALAESQKVAAVLKDFFRQMFERYDYQIGVFAEANSLNSVPEALLQFFPHRKVILAPGLDERERFFMKLRAEALRHELNQVATADTRSVETFLDIYGLNISDEEARGLAKNTQGFTYRDLIVLARGIRQEMRQAAKPLDVARKYKASLPQFLTIEIPRIQEEDVVVSPEVRKRVERAVFPHQECEVLRPARGVLFYGPPGTGKTLLTKLIASKVGGYFIYLTPAQIYSKYVGESEKNLKEVFTLSRELAAAGRHVIVFIDELDGFAPSREYAESRAIRSVLSVLLAELDGMQALTNVTVIGATNRPGDIDEALVRPGRFEEWVQFYPPGRDEAIRILELHIGKFVRGFEDKPVDIERLRAVLSKPEIGERIFSAGKGAVDFENYLSGADLALAAKRAAYEVAKQPAAGVYEFIAAALAEVMADKEALRNSRGQRAIRNEAPTDAR